MTQEIKTRKKLIEVALPLEAINVASAHEKSIRRGHPSTLHLWWARRPLAAARAVIFSQLVDDPSSVPEEFETKDKQEVARKQLFDIIENLVKWENTTNKAVLEAARKEIWRSWRRACSDNKDHPNAKELFNPDILPAFHDPFAGGGSLPLEAQRLGLESYASDLNPIAVLINKAMIEIPPKFADKPPVNPEARKLMSYSGSWKGVSGLAEDVRYYGKWMRDEAEKRIGHLYPEIEITPDMVDERPDLKKYLGQKLKVIAWLWSRTVKSPNPAFADVEVPLAATFMLSTKSDKEVYIEPVIEGKDYRFRVRCGQPCDVEAAKSGTKLNGSNFHCLMSGVPISGDYIKSEGQAGRMGTRLMAVVAEGVRGRVYLSPDQEMELAAKQAKPTWKPEQRLVGKSGDQLPLYGMSEYWQLFTPRQLVTLTTLCDLVSEARDFVKQDAIDSGLFSQSDLSNNDCSEAAYYANAIAVYLSFAVSKTSNRASTLCTYKLSVECPGDSFSRQALAMTWDFAEANSIGGPSGSFDSMLKNTVAGLVSNGATCDIRGTSIQDDATLQKISMGKFISTDPPYYDNICYADLSDYFYIWLRRSIRKYFPELFSTVLVPKTEELVANQYHHKNKKLAEAFFLSGMTKAMHNLAYQAHPVAPITIYYAFKQNENKTETGITNTGWAIFLDAIIRAGLTINGTWPIRTERENRKVNQGANALASSIVIVCRMKSITAKTSSKRDFLETLKQELPIALTNLQKSNIAPVDLQQAILGPGMAVYTRYSSIMDAEGKNVTVSEAISLILQILDEALAEQEGDFDNDTRWALVWFEQFGFEEADYGTAEQLSKSKITSVEGIQKAGIIKSGRGKVRLVKPSELRDDWDPETEKRLTVWEIVHHLIRAVETGESEAAELISKLGANAEPARELAYRLFTVCERRNRSADAIAYNSLVQLWPDIYQKAEEMKKSQPLQSRFDV